MLATVISSRLSATIGLRNNRVEFTLTVSHVLQSELATRTENVFCVCVRFGTETAYHESSPHTYCFQACGCSRGEHLTRALPTARLCWDRHPLDPLIARRLPRPNSREERNDYLLCRLCSPTAEVLPPSHERARLLRCFPELIAVQLREAKSGRTQVPNKCRTPEIQDNKGPFFVAFFVELRCPTIFGEHCNGQLPYGCLCKL